MTGGTSETCGTGESSRFSELRNPNVELRIALVALGVHVAPFPHVSPVLRVRRLTSSSTQGTGCIVIQTGLAQPISTTERQPS